jgi:Tfp pilus assembly protein FimT
MWQYFKRILKRKDDEQGITIVETVIGFTILAILSYLAIAEFTNSTSAVKESSLAQKIVTDVRYAQEMALNYRQEVKFLVEPDYNQYSLKWQNDTYLTTPIAEQNFIFNINTSKFNGMNITSTGFSNGLLTFNSKGQPLDNGALITMEKTLVLLNNSVSIKIVPSTGACFIQD